MAQARIADPVIRRLVTQGQRFEAPDFVTVFKEEVAKRIVEPTAGEKIVDVGTTIARTALSMAAITESGVASLWEAASKIPGPQGKVFAEFSKDADTASGMLMWGIRRHAAGDPRLEESFLWRQLPEAIGSFGGFMLITAGATGIGGPPAGIAAATMMATTMGVGESRQRRQLAIKEGVLSPDEAQLAELNGALPGVIQVLPVIRALRLMGPKASIAFSRGIRKWAVDGVETAFEEGVVETLGQIGQDAIAKWQFDPNQVIGETAIQTAKVSGAGGFVVGFATSAIRGVRLGRYRKPPDGGNGFRTEAARRIMADALALEEAARRHIDEAATDDRPAQRQALDLLRVNITNLEFVKQGRKKIVADLMERFGLSKRKASRMYIRVKAAYEMVKLAETAAQPAGILRQAQIMVNEALTEPTDPATPQTVDQPIPPERNTFAQSVRQDLYREFRNELTELDVVEEPLGATLPRGVPARFLVGEGGETLPIPLSPFPVTDPAEIRQLGLREHRESISFRDFRLMDLFEANTLAELLQEANPRDAFAVFRAGEDDWRVFFKQAEEATLFEQEPSRGEEAIQEGPEGPGPGPAGVIAAGPEAPPGGPGVVGGGQPGLLGEQFAGPITGRQAELPLPIPSAVELEVEAEAARSRRELAEDESGDLFPQDVANPVPFDDALETAPDGLEFTGTAMPEGDIRAELLRKFEEEPAEALLFAEAMGIKNADQKTPAEIIDEFWATKEEALKDDDGPADVIPLMLYSGIPIPEYLPAMVVKGAGEFAKPTISIAFVDLVDRLRRVSDNPLIQQAADAARLATLDAKAFIGELSALLDPVLRMTGKHALTEEGKATQRIQQIQWDENGEGGVSIFHLALEDKLPPGVTLTEIEQQIIELGKQVIALGGQLHEREGTMRFNHRTGEWEPFQQIGRAVAPRISTLELLDLVAQGEGGRFDLIVRLIAEHPDNRALLENKLRKADGTLRHSPEEEVRRILLQQRDEMRGATGEPSAFRRINAEFARIWPYFPTMIHDPTTGARVQLIENNPFHYFERYANLTAGRLAFIRHFGQELEKPSLVNQLVEIVQNERSGSDEVIAVTRALHGLPVERTFWTQPGSAPHQFGIGLRHASSVLKAGALSMTWPQNLLEPLGRILGLAGGPMKQDFWLALGNLYGPADERRAATLVALRSLGAVDHWIRNLSIDPNRPGETATRMLREIPTVLVRVFWKEQSRLAAAIGLAKGERMAAGRGKESDVQDIMSMLGFDRPTAEAMARGEGTPEQYLMIARRAGAYTTNQPMVKAEQSRLEHSRIFRLLFAFTTYGFMGVRWMASNLRTTMPIMRDLWRNPKSKTAWNRARVNLTKISTQAMGLTTAGAGSYFLIALATGGLHGLKLAWNEAKDDPVEFLLDSFLYTMFAGPFGAVMRLTQNQSRNRFESLIRVTWPGAIAVEITDMLSSTGRYRDREFWGRDGKLMRFTDRFVPINRMIWQGLAVVGIGKEEQQMRTTIMAYWRARQDIAPVVRSQRGEPQVEALREAFEQHREFRIQMRLAYDAMLHGDNPQEFINAAFATDLTKTRGDVAGSVRRRKLLTGKFADQSSIEFTALRSRLGDDGILILRQHDEVIEAVAQSIKPKVSTVRFRPVPERTLNGVTGRYRR